jgi:hypothetical protein
VGAVTGVANGRATIYIVSGGRQGQQVIRVVPDYQGAWSGGLRVVSCTHTGIWAEWEFCNELPAGAEFGYTLSLEQAGELMTARASFGNPIEFPAVAASLRADGTASFAATAVITDSGATFTIDSVFDINSPRLGELTGTVTEVWRVPNVPGDMRLVQDIVSTRRTGITALGGEGGGRTKLELVTRMPR